MEITEVRIEPAETVKNGLLATAEVLFDSCFLVKEMKIIEKPDRLHLCMPNRRVVEPCGKCGCKNHLQANFCNKCGAQLPKAWLQNPEPPRMFADLAHPIHSRFRAYVESAVFGEYQQLVK